MALAEDLGGDSDFLFRRQLAVWRALYCAAQRCAERIWDRELLDHGGNDPVGLFDYKKCVRWRSCIRLSTSGLYTLTSDTSYVLVFDISIDPF